MEINVAQAILKALQEEKVDTIFGYPGGNILPVYDALYDSEINHILVRHEQGAVHAAEGYARATGKVGVCIATSGPGATNLVTGIANAFMDSIPIIVITGQVPTTMVGTDAFQEVDITGITFPIVKHNYLVKDPKKILQVIKEAFHIASTGRPGPVVIDIPKDVLQTKIKYNYPEKVHIKGYKPTYQGNRKQIIQGANLIKNAEKPVIYAGGGVINSRADELLMQLAEKNNIPVVSTLMGLGGFPSGHPLSLGLLGLHGSKYANLTVTNCDLLIAVGARFDDRVTGNVEGFAPKAKIIHIDIDPAEIGKNHRVNLPIVGDVKSVLEQLLPQVGENNREDWLKQVSAWKAEFPLVCQVKQGMNPQETILTIAKHTKDEAVIVTDVGQHQMWVAQFYPFKKTRSFITSGGLGTMGFGLPAAVGAQTANPNRKVVLITGDGSFQMCMQEFATAVENGLPVKVIIFNNNRLGMVRQLQQFYCKKRYMGVDFSISPDFAKFAEVYGVKGYNVTSVEELDKVLADTIDNNEPLIINCTMGREENVLPMVLAGTAIDEAIDRA
jgi:acetolactate synthase I/II/III large subunit